jgi:predicted permease
MLDILWVTTPFFALIVAGFWATRSGRLPLAAIPGLNNFVLYFALPCMLFRFGATTDIHQLLDPAAALLWGLVAVLMVGLALGLTLGGRINWNDGALGALVAAFPNTGFMGVPLLIGLLGQSMAAPIMLSIAIDMVFTTSLCIALSRLDGHGLRDVGAALRKALVGVSSNPMAWSILLGAGFSALGWRLPAPAEQTVWMLADAASPAALFTIGAVLARGHMNSDGHGGWHGVWVVVGLKLLLHPLLVLALGLALMQLGVALSASALTTLVMVAALPSASNVSMLAERFGADSARIVHIILATTVLAFVSFSAVVYGLTRVLH